MKGGKREGAGRPKGTTKENSVKRMTITIYPEEEKIIKQLAAEAGKSVSRFLIERAISSEK